MTREEVMKDPTIHKLTKQILELTAPGRLDPVDQIYDVELALEVLKAEWLVMVAKVQKGGR